MIPPVEFRVVLDVSPALAQLLGRVVQGLSDVANRLGTAEWNRRAALDRAAMAAAQPAPALPARLWVRPAVQQRSGADGLSPPGSHRAAGGAAAPEFPGTASDAVPAEAGAAAHAPPAGGRRRSVWLTPEREQVLRSGWRVGERVGDIRRKLEALSGGALPDNSAIAARAARLGLRRPQGFAGTRRMAPGASPDAAARGDGAVPSERSAVAAPPVQPPAPTLAATMRVPRCIGPDGALSLSVRMLADADTEAAPSPITAADMRAWARNNKVPEPDADSAAGLLRRVNASRVNFGLPPWHLVLQRGPQPPLPSPLFWGRPAINAVKP